MDFPATSPRDRGPAGNCRYRGITLVAGLTGGLDRLVLAEAPKSLQYRLEYWWTSLQLIRESPFIGVGPGQFRQNYLAHKLPQGPAKRLQIHTI
jgi:O-antigen ligase